jgi:hypothetical protein
MPDLRTYKGGCHCGQVRYEVTMDLKQVVACNCSICTKRGFLFAFVEPQQFVQHSGGEGLTDYQFNKHVIHHLFCPVCGVESFARGTAPNGREMVAINVRCLDDVEVSTLPVTPFDGRSL